MSQKFESIGIEKAQFPISPNYLIFAFENWRMCVCEAAGGVTNQVFVIVSVLFHGKNHLTGSIYIVIVEYERFVERNKSGFNSSHC